MTELPTNTRRRPNYWVGNLLEEGRRGQDAPRLEERRVFRALLSQLHYKQGRRNCTHGGADSISCISPPARQDGGGREAHPWRTPAPGGAAVSVRRAQQPAAQR